MDVVSARGEGAKVYGGFYAAPESEIKKRQNHRQTDRGGYPATRCRIEAVALCLLSVLFVLERKRLSGNHGVGRDKGRDSGPKLAAPLRLSVCLIELIS